MPPQLPGETAKCTEMSSTSWLLRPLFRIESVFSAAVSTARGGLSLGSVNRVGSVGYYPCSKPWNGFRSVALAAAWQGNPRQEHQTRGRSRATTPGHRDSERISDEK